VIVDAHVHLLPDRLAAAIRRFFDARMTPGLVSLAFVYPPGHGEAREALVAAGVDRCWSLPYAHKPGVAGELNRWMSETFGSDPIVVPGGTVHPGDDVEDIVREACGPLRLRVLKLHCSVGRFDADDPRLEPLWRLVSSSGHPVVVHAGHAENGTTTADEIAPIARVARRWPEARLVVAHCGAPAIEATLALLRETRSLCADLTPIGRTLAPVTRAAIAGLESRLLFGSDAPNTGVTVEQGVAFVRALDLAAGGEAAVLGANAERLLCAASSSA
jgi:uncharacterized protein